MKDFISCLCLQLERLYCGSNKIKVVPEEISFCARLAEIDLSNNIIEEVPLGIAMCAQLNLLHLGKCHICLCRFSSM